MQTYEFELYLPDVREYYIELEDQLFLAGCDDATIGFQNGRFTMLFAREAESRELAIASAIQQVKSTGRNAFLMEITK